MQLTDPLLGNLRHVVPSPWAEVLLVLAAAVAGGLVGWERELKAKAAGLRTVTLIAIGAAVYTLVSIAVAGDRFDPARLAAQIVPGVGFLGAGVILRERGQVVGLTTAATIWAVAAIGVVVGAGYAAAGFALGAITVLVLVGVARLEVRLAGPCRMTRFRVEYDPAAGKTLLKIRGCFDAHHAPFEEPRPAAGPAGESVEIRCCDAHVQHRGPLVLLAEIPEIRSVARA